MSRKYTFAELSTVCLLLVAPIVRLALLTGPTGSDDLNYFHFSQHLSHFEHFTQLHHHAGRLVFLLLVGVPAALMGSITSGAIVNVLVLSLRDVLVVWFVRRETNMPCAAIAAAVVSLNAISLAYAGIMIPDPLLSLLMFASAVALYEGLYRGGLDGGGMQGSGLRETTVARGRLVAAAGALAALSYSAKDPGILMTAPSMICIALVPGLKLGTRVRLGALYVIGLVFVAALESLAYWFISGDFLYRSHALSKIHNASIVEAPNLIAFLHSIYWNLRLVTAFEVASTQLLIASAFVFVLALFTRSRLTYFSATGLFIGLYLIFGTSSFTRFMPLPVQDRYFEPLVAFLAVSAAALTYRFRAAPHAWSIKAATAAVTVMVVASIPSITANAGDVAFSGVGRNAGIAIRSLHASRPDLPIMVSPMLHRMIESFVTPELFASLRTIDGANDENGLAPGFYLAHPWEQDTPSAPLLAAMKKLPVYLVVDEDQRILGRYAMQPRATNRGAIVHVRQP